MAVETTKPVEKVAAVAEAPAPAEAEKAADGEEVEKEEIKACSRPDKVVFETEVDSLNVEIASLNEKLQAVDAKITAAKIAQGGDGKDELSQSRAQMKVLRDQKERIMRERQEILDVRNAAKESLDKKITAAKASRSELKYSSVEEIEKQIKELEARQQMTSMTLQAEKKLLKEIDVLKQSKKAVTALASHTDGITTDRKASQDINEQLTAKSQELDAVKKQMDEQRLVLDALNGENSEKRSVLPALFREKDGFRSAKMAKVETIKALRTDFRKAENDWRNWQREVRNKRDAERKAEEGVRKAEAEERKKAWDLEEAKKVPYEEEMALCDYLANYLTVTFTAADDKKEAVAEVLVSEFEGFKLMGKAAKRTFDADDDFCNLGKGKAKGRGNKKGGKKVDDGKIILSTDSFENFGMIALLPPTSKDQIAAKIVELAAKKVFFSTLARGAAPSIRDKQLKEGAERAKKEREEQARENSNPDRPDRPPRVEPKEDKPKKAPKAEEFNASMADKDLFPGLPPAQKKAAAPEPAKDDAAAAGDN